MLKPLLVYKIPPKQLWFYHIPHDENRAMRVINQHMHVRGKKKKSKENNDMVLSFGVCAKIIDLRKISKV